MRPITKATRGVLKSSTSKKVLVLAMSGVMYFGTTTEPPIIDNDSSVIFSNSEKQALREKILIDDSELVAIVELTLRNFTI